MKPSIESSPPARDLLLDRPFAALTVDDVMARAGLTRTVFYNQLDTLAQMAPELLPDAEGPTGGPRVAARLAGRTDRGDDHRPRAVVRRAQAVCFRAIDAAAASDPEVAAELDRALVGPRRLLKGLVAHALPPADPPEFSLLLMATHRAYLLDKFGGGDDSRKSRQDAVAALAALWQRLLAE